MIGLFEVVDCGYVVVVDGWGCWEVFEVYCCCLYVVFDVG